MKQPSVLLIEGSDFETFPAGGQLTMARALMKLFGNTLALVGMEEGDNPIGRWTEKQVGGSTYLFFPAARRETVAGEKPVVPARLTFYAALRRFKSRILSIGCRSAFIQAPEALLAVSNWKWDNLGFWFAGVENPLRGCRYPLLTPLWRLFDRSLFLALNRADLVLAAADEDAINGLVSRSKGRLRREQITGLPTCVDTSVFSPAVMRTCRVELGIPHDHTVFVNSGRISRLKGWELLLGAIECYRNNDPHAMLFFVGDGEDRCELQTTIDARGLREHVRITGFQSPSGVASYLNAANAIVFASYTEGWSVAMLEALACGKPLVSTPVSGASVMIESARNGFIVNDRDPLVFARAMANVILLRTADQVSTSIARRFELAQMGQQLVSLWSPFAQNKMEANGEIALAVPPISNRGKRRT